MITVQSKKMLYLICLLSANIKTIDNLEALKLLALEKLIKSYPEHIQAIDQNDIIWTDNTRMSIHDPYFAQQLEQPFYISGKPEQEPQNDPGRFRYEPFFCKMYGNSAYEVEQHLEPVAWMPNIFTDKPRKLYVTKINNVHEKIKCISDELEQLVQAHPEYIKFLENPGGTYCWRNIANTNRLSCHSFGMTLDINVSKSHYWQWYLKKHNITISEDAPLTYQNEIPWEIVEIFEKYGFIWGGKWYHYDTMHFEYRPELIIDSFTYKNLLESSSDH